MKAKILSSAYLGASFAVTLKWKNVVLKAETKSIFEVGQSV